MLRANFRKLAFGVFLLLCNKDVSNSRGSFLKETGRILLSLREREHLLSRILFCKQKNVSSHVLYLNFNTVSGNEDAETKVSSVLPGETGIDTFTSGKAD